MNLKTDNAKRIVELMSDDQIIDIIQSTEKFNNLVFNNPAAADAVTERYNEIISGKENIISNQIFKEKEER